jgi:acetolactate synthase I/III small subunit
MDNPLNYPAHSISLLVHNKPGVLVRVALVFSRRGYNIDSLVVSPTVDGDFARMNIVARGNPETLEQIIHQLEKLIDVIHATDLTGRSIVEKELALIKVQCNVQERTELLQLVQHFKARTIDLTETSMVIEIAGSSEKIDALRTLINRYKLVEFIRTGKVIMARGENQT